MKSKEEPKVSSETKLSKSAKRLFSDIEEYKEEVNTLDYEGKAISYFMMGRAYNKLAEQLSDLSYQSLALEALQKAISLEDDNPKYLIELAELFVKKNQYDNAVQILKKIDSLPEEPGFTGMYIKNTKKDLEKAIAENINKTKKVLPVSALSMFGLSKEQPVASEQGKEEKLQIK